MREKLRPLLKPVLRRLPTKGGRDRGEGLRLHMTPEFRPTNCWLKTPAALTTGVHQVQPLMGNVRGYTKNVVILT